MTDLERCLACGEQKWKHYYNTNQCSFVPPTPAVLRDEKVYERISTMRSEGLTYAAIGKILGLATSTVFRIFTEHPVRKEVSHDPPSKNA